MVAITLSKLGFPQDETSHGTGPPIVPLSGYKKNFLSRCPSVPGRHGTKSIKIFQRNNQISCFWISFSCFRTSFSCFRTSFSCFRMSFSALSRFVPCPIPDFGCPGPSRLLARFLAGPVVPLSRVNEGTSVPLSQKVALSRSIGNPNLNQA